MSAGKSKEKPKGPEQKSGWFERNMPTFRRFFLEKRESELIEPIHGSVSPNEKDPQAEKAAPAKASHKKRAEDVQIAPKNLRALKALNTFEELEDAYQEFFELRNSEQEEHYPYLQKLLEKYNQSLESDRKEILSRLDSGASEESATSEELFDRLAKNIKKIHGVKEQIEAVNGIIVAFTDMGRNGWKNADEAIPVSLDLLDKHPVCYLSFSISSTGKPAELAGILLAASKVDPLWLDTLVQHIFELKGRLSHTNHHVPDLMNSMIAAELEADKEMPLSKHMVHKLAEAALEGDPNRHSAANEVLWAMARDSIPARILIMKEMVAILGSKRFQTEYDSTWKANAIDTVGTIFAISDKLVHYS